MNFKKLLAAAVLALGISFPIAAATEGTDYEVLKKPIPPLQDDKIEVLEFFGYSCIHCKNLDPVILKHARTLPADVRFRTEHVVWGPDFIGLARLAAAVNQSGLKHQANPAVFSAILDQRLNLSDTDTAKQWLAAQTGFDGKKIIAALDSFHNQQEANRMAKLTQDFLIDSTPTVIVGGKYRVMFKNGYPAGMKTIDELIEKVRAERGMKTPATKAAVKSRGAAFAGAALK